MDQHNHAILVISADRDVCDSIDRLLTRQKCDVLRAYDGESGWQALKRYRISLVILDGQLPDESAIELSRRLKKKGSWRKLPLLLLKGEGMSEEDVAYSLADGCGGKPIREREILGFYKKAFPSFLEDTVAEYLLPERNERPLPSRKKEPEIESELNKLVSSGKPVQRRPAPSRDEKIGTALEELHRLAGKGRKKAGG